MTAISLEGVGIFSPANTPGILRKITPSTRHHQD